MTPERLIFIYNADGGIAQGVMDSVHKTLSPSTYACSLCAVTHGVFRMDPKWRAWLKALPIPTEFEHKDDTPHRDVPLPAILAERSGQVATLIGARELADVATVDALIALLEARLGRTI
jgi:hypothetical protein